MEAFRWFKGTTAAFDQINALQFLKTQFVFLHCCLMMLFENCDFTHLVFQKLLVNFMGLALICQSQEEFDESL